MATIQDLIFAFISSPHGDRALEVATANAFGYLENNLQSICHWPTRAVEDLFAIEVQKQLKALENPND